MKSLQAWLHSTIFSPIVKVAGRLIRLGKLWREDQRKLPVGAG